jgi:hypothetical protein
VGRGQIRCHFLVQGAAGDAGDLPRISEQRDQLLFFSNSVRDFPPRSSSIARFLLRRLYEY